MESVQFSKCNGVCEIECSPSFSWSAMAGIPNFCQKIMSLFSSKICQFWFNMCEKILLCSEMVKICILVKVSYAFEWDFYCFKKQNCLVIFEQKLKISAIVGEGEKGSRTNLKLNYTKNFIKRGSSLLSDRCKKNQITNWSVIFVHNMSIFIECWI